MQLHKGKDTPPNGLRMMSPPGLKIYLRPCVTLTFDLLTPKLIVSCHCPVSFTYANLHQNQLIRFQKIVFTSLVTDKQMGGQTNGRMEKTVRQPANLAS